MEQAKKLNSIAWILTVVVLLLIGAMRRVKIDVGIDLSFLAGFHAMMNVFTAIALIIAFVYIKQKNIERHRQAIYAAMVLSFLFLLSYVGYHFTTPETIYGDTNHDGVLDDLEAAAAGAGRTVYLVVLLSHIVLAGIIFPFILFTFIRGYTGQVERHRKMAKWVFPIWLYVAISGPIVYLMLMPYYK